jgi:hypothetical protein
MSDKDKPFEKSQINTGGGAYIGGNVKAGGDFVGRDQTKVTTSQEGVTLDEVTRLLSELCQILSQAKLDEDTTRIIKGITMSWYCQLKQAAYPRTLQDSSLDQHPVLQRRMTAPRPHKKHALRGYLSGEYSWRCLNPHAARSRTLYRGNGAYVD